MRVIVEEAVESPNLPGATLGPSPGLSNSAKPAPASRKRDRLFPECTDVTALCWFLRPAAACWAALFFALIAVQSVCAAPGVTAHLDRNTITLGENATLSISFENLNPSGAPGL